MAKKNAANRPTPWLKRVLIPFWLVQLALMFFIIIDFSYIIAESPNDIAVYQMLLILLCGASAVLDVTELILFLRRNLQPLLYLIFQVIKGGIWFALFLNAIVQGIVKQSGEKHVDTEFTYGSIIFGVLFFAFLGSLIYGSVIFHRHRRSKRRVQQNSNQNSYYTGPYGQYQPVENPTPAYSSYTPEGAAPTTYSGEGVVNPLADNGKGPQQAYVSEMLTPDARGANNTVMELSATPEVYELSSTKHPTSGNGW